MNMKIFEVTGLKRDKIAIIACKSMDELIFETCKRLNFSTEPENKACTYILFCIIEWNEKRLFKKSKTISET